MRPKRFKVMVVSLWLVQHVRERHKGAEHEAYYKTVLTEYASELKPGMTRERVELHLQSNGKRFRQMCCVAALRGEHVDGSDAGWDDLVKIGEDSVPWFCNQNNVYIAFEFNPKSFGELPKTNVSDILKRLSVF